MKLLTNLDLLKNELQNAVLQPLAIAPSTPKQGQFYYNSNDNLVYIYNGSNWVPIGVVYNQESSTGVVITGLNSSGDVTTTSVVNLTLTDYNPVKDGYVNAGMTFQEALSALDTAVKNAVSGGGEVNQNAWSYIIVPTQSTNNGEEVIGNVDSTTLTADSKQDTFTVASGDEWIIVKGDTESNTITLGHKFSSANPDEYGTATSIPVFTLDNTGHIIEVSDTPIVGAQYITGLTSDAQTQLNNKIPLSQKGQPNGVATLGNDGLIPSTQLPSYVDEIIEAYIVGETPLAADWLSTTSGGHPLTPTTGKIYVIVSPGQYENEQYRWAGTTYVLCNPSDVNSVNGQTGIVVLTQDDIESGDTYTQFSITEQTKLSGIATGATVNNITLNGQSNQNPSFFAPTTAGTSGQILQSNGSNQAPTWINVPQSFKKYIATNPQLNASGGSWTWSIASSTHGILNNGIIVQIYIASTGEFVMADVNVNPSNYNITITINDVNAQNTLNAGTYRAIIFG